MRVLITNNSLAARAGSELYVRDVAIELMRRGHQPVAYSTQLGAVAEELRAATVPVIDRLNSLGEIPDIIHGHHHYETLSALLRFPSTPAIYYCHGWIPWQEAALKHPNILRYVAVDDVCRERLIAEGGIRPSQIELILNFFDQRLFPPRPPLPAMPKMALAFSNEFTEQFGLPILREACARCGIQLHVRGLGNGNSTPQPGPFLAGYDVVFAKARSAIEALAVGTAVVLCTPGKLGPMVTTENFASLRQWNFGIRTLAQPLDVDLLTAELRKYDFEDAAKVSQLARGACELQPAVDRIVDLYQRVIDCAARRQSADQSEAGACAAQYLENWAAHYKEHFKVMEDRDRWIERCQAAEHAVAQCNDRLGEMDRIVEDRQRWTERCQAAEQAVAKCNDRLGEMDRIAEDRQRWAERCQAAEQALAGRDEQLRIAAELSNSCSEAASRAARELDEIASQRAGWVERCSAAEGALAQQKRLLREVEQESLHALNLLGQRDDHVALLAQELAAMRTSATWRWTQGILQSSPVQLLFGSLIRWASGRLSQEPPPVLPEHSLSKAGSSPSPSALPFPDREPQDPAISNLQLRADRMISEHGFLGVPRETFSQAGREQLVALLREGLRPESRVLEFGCGCLRIGFWLIRFLDAGRYYGIESSRQRVDCGLRYLFTPEEIEVKQPRFDFNSIFNSSVFGARFDFFLARSIWTHASKPQIEATLDSFLRDAAPAATFLTSYLPARSPEEDYLGSKWVGTSHESHTPGVIRHSLPWILDQCRQRGLKCDEIPGLDCDSQLWLRIRH